MFWWICNKSGFLEPGHLTFALSGWFKMFFFKKPFGIHKPTRSRNLHTRYFMTCGIIRWFYATKSNNLVLKSAANGVFWRCSTDKSLQKRKKSFQNTLAITIGNCCTTAIRWRLAVWNCWWYRISSKNTFAMTTESNWSHTKLGLKRTEWKKYGQCCRRSLLRQNAKLWQQKSWHSETKDFVSFSRGWNSVWPQLILII